MKNTIVTMILSTLLVSFSLTANDDVIIDTPKIDVINSGALNNNINIRPCRYSENELFAYSSPLHSPDPIYVGGARYHLKKSDFTPIYETRWVDYICNVKIPVTMLVGLEIALPVDGDYGQNLIFDINGRTNTSTKLKANCGSFIGGDSGTKYVISKRQRTNGSCKTMNIELRFEPYRVPSTIDLNVTISEQI